MLSHRRLDQEFILANLPEYRSEVERERERERDGRKREREREEGEGVVYGGG